MFRLAVALLGVCLLAAASAAQQPIRLVVIVVLDQFRADYLTTFASHWRDGFKTLLTLRRAFPDLAIAILTSSRSKADRNQAAECGARYVEKPSDLQEFVDAVGGAVKEMLPPR